MGSNFPLYTFTSLLSSIILAERRSQNLIPILFCSPKESNADSPSDRYQLVLMTHDSPNHRDPFVPAYNLDGNPPKGITYGAGLSVAPCSKELKDLVQECLYENIEHRPNIQDLKQKARLGIKACIRAGAVPEPWEDFLPPEPLPLHIANPPARPVLPDYPTKAEKEYHKAAMKVFRKAARDDIALDEAKQLQPRHKRVKLKQLQQLFKGRCQHVSQNDSQCKNRFWTDGTIVYCHRHRA